MLYHRIQYLKNMMRDIADMYDAVIRPQRGVQMGDTQKIRVAPDIFQPRLLIDARVIAFFNPFANLGQEILVEVVQHQIRIHRLHR